VEVLNNDALIKPCCRMFEGGLIRPSGSLHGNLPPPLAIHLRDSALSKSSKPLKTRRNVNRYGIGLLSEALNGQFNGVDTNHW